MREVMGSDETMENNNDNNTGGIEAIDANETVQENNQPDNVSTTNESESSVRRIWDWKMKHFFLQNSKYEFALNGKSSAKFEAYNLT